MITLDLKGRQFHHYPDQKRMIDRVLQLGIFTYLMNEQDNGRYNNHLPHSDQGVRHTYQLIEWRTDHVNKLKIELQQQNCDAGRWLKNHEIEFREWEIDLFEQIYLPISIALQEYRKADTDCEYVSDDEYYKNHMRSWVKGKGMTCEAMRLKEGMRFINGRDMRKYIFLRQSYNYMSPGLGLMPGTVYAICEDTRNEVYFKDYELFYRLKGTGDTLTINAPQRVEIPKKEYIPRDKHGQIQMF